MNSFLSVLVAVFAFIWISSIECTSQESYTENERWKYNMPSFFKRTYKVWSRNNTCNYERMKSLALDLTPLRGHRHRLTTQMAQGALPLKKAELRIEFYGIANKTAMQNRTYFAEITPLDIGLNTSRIKSSPAYADEELVELTFDITKLYNATKHEDLNVLKFRLKLLQRNRRTAKSLSRTTIKAFIIVYERLKSCGFQDAFKRDLRTRRSKDIVPDLHVPEGTLTTDMVAELQEKEEERCETKESLVTFASKGMDFVIYPSHFRTSDCVLDLAQSFRETDLSKPRSGLIACCVPTDYYSVTMVFRDVRNDGMPVMSKFNDMAAKRCGCRLI